MTDELTISFERVNSYYLEVDQERPGQIDLKYAQFEKEGDKISINKKEDARDDHHKLFLCAYWRKLSMNQLESV